jgi:rare lipoprotein A
MIKQLVMAIIGCVMFASNMYAQEGTSLHSPRITSKKNIKIQYGVASFYANKFNGKRTANGEVFSQKKLTAASNTLSLGTWVKVTNLHNKRTVIVKITDRMHHRNKRIIDLSSAAAHRLDYTGRGLTRVRVDVLGKHKPADAESMADNK